MGGLIHSLAIKASLMHTPRMRFLKLSFAGAALFSLFFACSSAFAQESGTKKIDDATLRALYEQSLRYSDDAYIQARIENERGNVRELIQEELNTLLSPLEANEEGEGADLLKALENQNAKVANVEQILTDRKVDLDLLTKEEQVYYLSPGSGTGSQDQFRLTKDHPELLAKRAVLEERITVLESLLALEQERLSKLVIEQRLKQFELLILIGKYLIGLAIVLLIEKLVRQLLISRISKVSMRYTVTKLFTSFVYIFVIVWIIGVIFSKQPGILASLAIIGAGLAISMQDLVKNFIGWLIIIQSQLFSKGDRIELAGIVGEVIDIGVFGTTLLEIGRADVLERTGKTLSMPNLLVLTHPVTNYNTTSDYVRAEMKFAITYESNWRRTEEILIRTLEEVTQQYVEDEQRQYGVRTRKYYIPHAVGTPRVHMDIANDGISFTLRFTVPIGERRPVVTEITKKVLDAFNADPSIDLAYNTTRIIPTPVNKAETD